MKRILESLQQSRTSEDTTAGHVNSVFTTREIPGDYLFCLAQGLLKSLGPNLVQFEGSTKRSFLSTEDAVSSSIYAYTKLYRVFWCTYTY